MKLSNDKLLLKVPVAYPPPESGGLIEAKSSRLGLSGFAGGIPRPRAGASLKLGLVSSFRR